MSELEQLGKCPDCGRNLSKTEDIDGVEIDYNFEDGEWEEANMDFYGNCNVRYFCEKCGEL